MDAQFPAVNKQNNVQTGFAFFFPYQKSLLLYDQLLERVVSFRVTVLARQSRLLSTLAYFSHLILGVSLFIFRYVNIEGN